MSEDKAPDLSRIVNLIMENPKLIEEISHLADEGKKSEGEISEPKAEAQEASVRIDEPVSARGGTKERRQMLLSAIKPYLSKERAGAIDSMMSIVDILDVMRQR